MSNKIKNGLVGTVVLIALGVIVLPDIFDAKKNFDQQPFTDIPPPPEFNEEMNTKQDFEPITLPDLKTKASKKTDVAWTLSLGVYKDNTTALALVKQLQNAGLVTYTLPKNPVSGKDTHVFVGPNLSKELLLEQKAKINEIAQIKAELIIFEPLNTELF